ncbi:MAG: TRAP transporter small permease subunit [Pseudomonadota bacterium]
MLQTIGDILNWAAAGLLAPLLILPLAIYLAGAREGRFAGALSWAGLYVGLLGSGVLFIILVPRLDGVDAPRFLVSTAPFFLGLMALTIALGGVSRLTTMLAVVFDIFVRMTGRAVMWLLLLMALVQFAVVLLRYVFGINYIFMQESITYMHGAVFLLAAGYALLTNDHVRVDIFYRDASEKHKALIDLLGAYLFLFPVCLLILWTASPYVARSWLVLEGSPDASGIQGVFILKSLVPAFAVLLAMAGFSRAHDAVRTLKGQG